MSNKLKKTLTLLIITFSIANPGIAQAQNNDLANDNLFNSLLGGFSQLFAGNNKVYLENNQTNFSVNQVPEFILVAPQTDTIEATVIRNRDKAKIPLVISSKTNNGKFNISFQDQTVIIDKYSLEIVAKESFFYNRYITLEFNWGSEIKISATDQSNQTSWLKSFLQEKPDYKNLPIVKKDRNSVHFQKPDGAIEANFSAGPINYQDETGQWQPIDTALKDKNGIYTGNGIPVSITKDGTVKIRDSNHSQKTNRFGWFDPESKTYDNLQELPIGKIIGNQFIRETDAYKHVLTALDNGLKEELILFSLPTLTTTKFSQSSYLVLETEVTGIDLPDGWIDEAFTTNNQTFPLPTAKDATGKEAPTKRFAKKIDSKQYIYTGIPYEWMTSAVYPVTIDPDFNGGTANGVTYGQNASYATSRSTSVGHIINDANLYVGNQLYSGEYYTYRFHILFDTSSIGADNIVTQVNLKMTPINKQTQTVWNVLIMKDDWSANNPIGAGNREAVFDNALAATQDDNIFHRADDMTNNVQYTSGNLNTSWVSKTGTTYYSIIGSHDLAATPLPTLNNYQHFASASHGTAAYRPVLTVTYTIPGPVMLEGINMEGISIN